MNGQDKILINNVHMHQIFRTAEYCRTLNAFLKLKID